MHLDWMAVLQGFLVWNCNMKVTLTPSRARGHVPTLLQMAGHGAPRVRRVRRTKTRKWQTVLTTWKRLPKRLIILVKPKKWRGTKTKFFPALRAWHVPPKTNLILNQKIWKNAMRAREPNSWPIRYHRTWTRELAVSYPSTIVHFGGGRSSPRNFWCFWYDELLKQPSQHLWQTVPHRSRHSCCACKSGVRWKGFFCVRPAYCWSQKQNDQLSHCKCELVWNWTKEYWRQYLCVNFGTLTLMDCK